MKTVSVRDRRRGQAMIEFVPSLILFFIVMSAGLSYYRLMRAAQIREEAVRNILFQKINYSGTLTSQFIENPASQAGGKTSVFSGDGGVAPSNPVLQNVICIGATPNSPIKSLGDRSIATLVDDLPTVNLVTYAVIYRYPSGPPCRP